MKFKHYIITRFNLPHNTWEKDKKGNVIDAKWLENRYMLFEKYCLATVASQTNLNFEWWVYFDSNLSEVYKEKNIQLQDQFPNLRIKFEDSLTDFWRNLPFSIYDDAISNDIKNIITTRLDNDDAIAVDFIEIIQNTFKKETSLPALFQFRYGYTFTIEGPPILRQLNYSKNAFISLAEKVNNREELKTVYAFAHDEWEGIRTVVIETTPKWMQVIHNKNILNTSRGIEVSPIKLKHDFKFEHPQLGALEHFLFITKKVRSKIKATYQKFK